MNTKSCALFLTAAGSVAILAGCGSGTSSSTAGGTTAAQTSGGGSVINAKGSSFVKPFLENVFEDYKKSAGVNVNYQGGGSGAGISALLDGTIPFAASDAPMKDEELAKGKEKLGSDVLNFPIVVGGIAVAYNLPDVKDLKLDAPAVAGIFSRKITKWNDPAIMSLNPGVTLPASDIAVIVRGDDSGSTYVFTDFLSSADSAWNTSLGKGKKINWPNGVTALLKSDGVTKGAKDLPGSITYVETSYAKNAKLGIALIKNKAGNFVAPDGLSMSAAAASAKLPEDFRASIVNGDGAQAYPITSFVFGLVAMDQTKNASGADLVKALRYAVTDGQAKAESLEYAKLPDEVAKKVTAKLDAIKVK